MATPVWLVNIIKKTFPMRFTLARSSRVPGLGAVIDRALFHGDDLMYLPRDRTIEVNAKIEGGDMVLPSQVVDHFIESAGRRWIMDTCICRDATHCRDYPIDLGCLFLGEASQGINPRLGRPASKDEALAHVRKCREAGLVHLVGRNKLDTVWLGVGPGDRLLTICNCCPCCCLWRALPQLNPLISNRVTRMPGVNVTVTGACTGCGACAEDVCFVNAIKMDGGRAVISGQCRGCGRCLEVCPAQAIQLTIDDQAFVDHAIQRIEPLVNLK
jgi:ferredoxin